MASEVEDRNESGCEDGGGNREGKKAEREREKRVLGSVVP